MKNFLFLILTLLSMSSCKPKQKPIEPIAKIERAWWKEGIVYQIYPRSFKDTDGDGVGDLRGIIQKLDYIKSLGVNIIWLNPIYDSPNNDNGYDISDYEKIMKEFGTMADFDEMLKGLHDRNIKLVMDLVVNHSSDEHEWFKQSRSSRDNKYRNFYHWWPAENGKPPHRMSFFDENGEAWRFDTTTNAYYLHYFSRKQPDLNWENQDTRDSIYKMMDSWFKKGVDGFRMDVIPFISKDTTWPILSEQELTAKYNNDSWAKYYADGPNLHHYLKEMNKRVLSKYDVVALGEGAGVTINQALDFVAQDRNELDLFFHFEGQALGLSSQGYKRLNPKGWTLKEFKEVYSKWSDVFSEKGWGSIYLGNHDQPRMVSRWGNDSPEFRVPSSKMLHTFLLSMRATPFIYHGDEIGMTNLKLDTITDYRDIETLNWYAFLSKGGADMKPYMEDWKITARDNGRSPFQWNDSKNGGFTTGIPWLKVNDNYTKINEAAQEDDPNSILNYFRKMVKLRKDNLAFVYGTYQLVQPEHSQIYAYTRSLGKDSFLVLLNFSSKEASINLAEDMHTDKIMIDNYDSIKQEGNTLILKPYQAIIYSLKL